VKILVITSKNDPHVGMVQKHLDEPFIILDPKDYPGKTMTYLWEPPFFKIWANGEDITECNAIWYRKPIFYEPYEIPTDLAYQRFAHSAYEHTFKALYALLRNKLWVSDPWAIFHGNNKLYQIELAYALGFKIPKTIVSGDPQRVGNFIDSAEHIITKPMTTESVQLGEKTYLMYTTSVKPGINLSGLPLAPAIFQEEVSNECDVRVTVIGERIFACEIYRTGTMAPEIDWRKGQLTGNLIYKACKPPFPEMCVELVRQMGLKFGAIDFIRDHEGQYWFMEINPNGQWGFIEENTGLPLSKAMAELLTGTTIPY